MDQQEKRLPLVNWLKWIASAASTGAVVVSVVLFVMTVEPIDTKDYFEFWDRLGTFILLLLVIAGLILLGFSSAVIGLIVAHRKSAQLPERRLLWVAFLVCAAVVVGWILRFFLMEAPV